jgi:hypothetical protein
MMVGKGIEPYLEYEAFVDLKNADEFMKVFNGGYFVEWECGADLSVDTIEAKMKIVERQCESSYRGQSRHYRSEPRRY